VAVVSFTELWGYQVIDMQLLVTVMALTGLVLGGTVSDLCTATAALQAENHERNAAEAALAQLNQSLEKRVQERTAELQVVNQELEAFSYSVAHDLRAPLRSIDGFSAALLNRCQAQHYLHLVRQATRQMGTLIDDLLKLARLGRQPIHRQAVDLSSMAADILGNLARRDPQHQVTTHVQASIIADADPSLLRVALENLLDNAWKFTGKTAAAHIGVRTDRRAHETVYQISDNGEGFDQAYSAKMFEPFQRLHSAEMFSGTGIGLAIVAQVITRHGGRIWAEGQSDGGATFSFTLPAPADHQS